MAEYYKFGIEERYYKALKEGINMETFLSAEIGTIEELIKKEAVKLKQTIKVQPETQKKEDFADKILEEFKANIAKYKDLRFHADANIEVRKLLGALNDLYNRYMPIIHDFNKKELGLSLSNQDLMEMDSRLRLMASVDKDNIPPRLTRYFALLNRFPRDYHALDREEKSFILELKQ